MGNTVVADDAQKIAIQKRLSQAAVADATASGLTFTHSTAYDAEWAAALAAEQAADPPAATPAHSHVSGDISDFQTAVDAAVVAYLAANPPQNTFVTECEENAGIAANQYEWSFGNGATGTDIGFTAMVPCELLSLSANADTFGTSFSFNIRRAPQSGGSGTIIETVTFTGQNAFVNLATPILFNPGETLVPQTGASVVGSWTDVRVFFRFREV